MKKILVSTSLIVLGSTMFSSCFVFHKQTKYNSYLVLHRKYNMEQIFNYPLDVDFWKVQDSSVYQMMDTLKYSVTFKELSK